MSKSKYVYTVASAALGAMRGRRVPEHLIRERIPALIGAMKAGNKEAFAAELRIVCNLIAGAR